MLNRIRLKTHFKFNTSIISILDQGIVSSANFFTGIIIGRYCAKDEFGYYLLGFTIIVTLFNIQNTLISGPYYIHIHTLKETEKKFFAGGTFIIQIGLVFTTVAILAIFNLIFKNTPLTRILWALNASIGLILLKEYVRKISYAHIDVISALLIDLSVAIIQISGLLLLSYIGQISVPRAFLIIGLTCGLVTIIWLVWKHDWFRISFDVVKSTLLLNWSIGRWLFAGILLYTLSQETYPWILTLFHDASVTGEFAACKGLIFLSNPFVIGICNYLGPATAQAYAKDGIDKLRHLIRKSTFLIGAVISLFCFFIFFLGDDLLVIIYGTKYANNGLVVFIYALSVLANVLTIPIGLGFWAVKRPDITAKASFCGLLVTVVLGIWLVKYFGILGVVFGLLACNMTESIFKFYFFRKLIMEISSGSLAENK